MRKILLFTILFLGLIYICTSNNKEYTSITIVDDFGCEDNEIPDERYLVSPATCTSKAVYYKSCGGNWHSNEIFEYGNPLGHSYNENNECERCGDKKLLN